MNREKIITVVLLVIILIGFGYWFSTRERLKSREFVGVIVSTLDNKVTLNGFYRVPDQPGKEMVDQKIDVRIVVGPKTKLVKTLLYYPTAAELEKTGGAYNPADLKKEIVEGTIEDLKSGKVDGFSALSEKNVYGKGEFEASEIQYIWTIRP